MVNRYIVRSILVFTLSIVVLSCGANGAYSEESRKVRKKRVKWVKSKHGLGALMKLSNDRGKMQKEYKDDTESYDELKKAIEHDVLNVGYPSFELKKKYGEPVVVVPEDTPGYERWVYKPGTSSFFDGGKVYLIFDSESNLYAWELIRAREKKKKAGE